MEAQPDQEQLEIVSEEVSTPAKAKWETPVVLDFKAVTVTRGVGPLIGDGISNLC